MQKRILFVLPYSAVCQFCLFTFLKLIWQGDRVWKQLSTIFSTKLKVFWSRDHSRGSVHLTKQLETTDPRTSHVITREGPQYRLFSQKLRTLSKQIGTKIKFKSKQNEFDPICKFSFHSTLLYSIVFFLRKCLDDWKNSKKVVCWELTTLRATINLEKNLFLLSNPEHKYDQDEVPSIFSPLSLAAICNDCHLLLSKTKAIKRNARRMS